MIRRSTVLVLFSLTGVTTTVGPALAKAALPSSEHPATPAVLLAQAEPQSPATAPPASGVQSPSQPAPFSVSPATSTNTGTAVPDLTNPQTRPAASALQSSQQAESVRALQQQLQERGYYEGPVDGLYGSGTQRAVQSFQQDAGLPSTGEIDIPTLQELTPAPAAADGAAAQAPDGSAAQGSPENGTDGATEGFTEGAEAPEPSGAAPASEASASDDNPGADVGLRHWLWPGIALIVALGSFALGFMVFNRTKDDDDLQLAEDTPWGTVSPDLPPQTTQAVAPAATGMEDTPLPDVAPPAATNSVSTGPVASSNGAAVNGHAQGQNASQGSAQHRVPNNGQNGARQPNSALDTASPVETTRLAKVNIIDELVGDLMIPEPSRRRKAIWELGQRGNSAAVQPLVNAMVGADSKEKSLILAALSEIGIRSLKPMNRALAIALQDENPEVRKNAIRDLTRIYDLVAQISQMLGHATEDEDPEVRQTANWALEQLGRIRRLPEAKHSLPTLDAQPHPAELLPGDRTN